MSQIPSARWSPVWTTCEARPRVSGFQSAVTILPPRTLAVDPEIAWKEICRRASDFPPFRVRLGDVAIFDSTSVIYLELVAGRQEIERLHESLSDGVLAFQEPFVYHPHITLAQELRPEEVGEVLARARRVWAEYSGLREFPVEAITFVQNVALNSWHDLGGLKLGAAPVLTPR